MADPFQQIYTVRDYPDDANHENGSYMNICSGCNEQFIGYKRRLVCNLCNKKEKEEMSEVNKIGLDQSEMQEVVDRLNALRNVGDNRALLATLDNIETIRMPVSETRRDYIILTVDNEMKNCQTPDDRRVHTIQEATVNVAVASHRIMYPLATGESITREATALQKVMPEMTVEEVRELFVTSLQDDGFYEPSYEGIAKTFSHSFKFPQRTLKGIVAIDEAGGIGKGNKLPWSIPEDLNRFKEITMGRPVIMGRKTFESIGRALPGRLNIVITRDTEWNHPDVLQVHSFNAALREVAIADLEDNVDEIFVIGGNEIFMEASRYIQSYEITRVYGDFGCDVSLTIDNVTDYSVINRSERMKSEESGVEYSFETWVKRPAEVVPTDQAAESHSEDDELDHGGDDHDEGLAEVEDESNIKQTEGEVPIETSDETPSAETEE